MNTNKKIRLLLALSFVTLAFLAAIPTPVALAAPSSASSAQSDLLCQLIKAYRNARVPFRMEQAGTDIVILAIAAPKDPADLAVIAGQFGMSSGDYSEALKELKASYPNKINTTHPETVHFYDDPNLCPGPPSATTGSEETIRSPKGPTAWDHEIYISLLQWLGAISLVIVGGGFFLLRPGRRTA